LQELEKIKTSLHSVSVQIRDLRIDTKIDYLQDPVDKIHVLYDQYMNAAAALPKAAQTHASDPKRYKNCVERCQAVGVQVLKKIYPALEQINPALVGNQSLLDLLHTAHFNHKKDFLAQYCTLKVVLLKYFLVEFHAIVLFDLARQDSMVKSG
jgi:hypothetical protein